MPDRTDSTTTTSGSGKENKELASSALESDKTPSAGDVDMGSLVSSPVPVIPA